MLITSLKTSNERPENLPHPTEEVPAVQKSIALAIFVIVLLTIPFYAFYLGSNPGAVILFFSLLLIVLSMIFIRSIIRKTGIPKEEWISSVFVSGFIFLAVALITFSLKMTTTFGSNIDNYINMLLIKKSEFFLLFLALLAAPVIFLYEELRAKRKPAALKG
ncbi:MAG: hypothetical protein M1536_02505 [Firmicutes bacterium]|nr:hypothetical protein [Bacillota bacterium]